ncbi:MAG: PAS domain-containing protein [Pirellulaceae bacterium]
MSRTVQYVRHDLIELAAAYAVDSILVTTAELDFPGPQILYANTAFARMTGYSLSEILGKTPRILHGPKTDRSTLQRLRQTLSQGDEFIGQTTNYKRDGTPFQLEWIIRPLKNSKASSLTSLVCNANCLNRTGLTTPSSRTSRFSPRLVNTK